MNDPNRMHVRELRQQQDQPKRKRMGSSVGPNKTEAAFAAWRRSLGYSLSYEMVKLRVGAMGSRSWFTPDWLEVQTKASPGPGITTLHITLISDDRVWAMRPILYDVKALDRKTGKYRAEDDALVKIKAAAVMHPYFRFALAWPSAFEVGDLFEILEVG